MYTDYTVVQSKTVASDWGDFLLDVTSSHKCLPDSQRCQKSPLGRLSSRILKTRGWDIEAKGASWHHTIKLLVSHDQLQLLALPSRARPGCTTIYPVTSSCTTSCMARASVASRNPTDSTLVPVPCCFCPNKNPTSKPPPTTPIP